MPNISTTSQSYQEFVSRLSTTEDSNFPEGERIKVCAEFQRGDDETGIWGLKMKQDLIDSLLQDVLLD